MKRLLLLFLLSNSAVAFSQSAFKLTIDSLSTVSLPGKPSLKKNDTTTVYFIHQYSAEYIILVQDFKKRKDFVLHQDSLSAFYQGVVEGGVGAARNSTLLSKNEVTVNGFKAIDFEYKVDSTLLPDVRFQRSIILNKQMITYCFWTFSDSAKINTPKKDAFFKSIAIIADKNKTKQYTQGNLATVLGSFAGSTMAIAVIALIGIGFVFLIRKLIYKKIK